MKTHMIAATALLTGSFATLSTAAEPTVGQLAPDFTAQNTEGEDVKLSGFRGGNAVVVFTRAHW